MTEQHPEQRPRPQYGEYASPEEQRARMSPPDAAPVQPPAEPAVMPPTATVSAASSGGHRHPVGRIITIALLVYGAVNVVLTAASFFDLAALMPQVYEMLGVPGDFTNDAAARGWGIAAALILVVGYVVTAVLAARAMRRGRHSWWIPLVGAVITYIGVYICIAVVLTGDAAFTQFVRP